jgi:hypothetical protein
MRMPNWEANLQFSVARKFLLEKYFGHIDYGLWLEL